MLRELGTMIHYHGTPLTPRKLLYGLAGRHLCVSFANPRDVDVALSIAQSVLFDNGAYSAFTSGADFDAGAYYAWLRPRLGHPHWAVIPDVIDGTEDEQRELVVSWPFDKALGAPVWHLGLSIEYLIELAREWPKVCFGSSQQYWKIGTPKWEARVDEAFDALAEEFPTLPWVHMLRGLSQAGKRWPFASADSANVSRNFKSAKFDPALMAARIDKVQAPSRWRGRAVQLELEKGAAR